MSLLATVAHGPEFDTYDIEDIHFENVHFFIY